MKKTIKKRKYSMRGGIPIYPGGFSCVFKPQLKCKNKNKTLKTNGISKLLFKKYAESEMENIRSFYNALRRVPKSHKYFLLKTTKMCSPHTISTHDLTGFNDMCTNFTERGVNESNINKYIDTVKIINMPDAGISINEWLFNTKLTAARIIVFNKLMAELILRAIVPMNKSGVIHNDMKEDNILISHSKTNPRPTIIDWGISGISTEHHPIPEIIMDRYISVSNPFSSIMFTTDFITSYNEFLKTHNNKLPTFRQELKAFAISQYLKFKDIGHYSYVEKFFLAAYAHQVEGVESASAQSQIIEKTYHAYASAYIADVLYHFTEFYDDAATATYVDGGGTIGRFQYVKYFTQVYIFNCDIWGTMCCYNVFFSIQSEPDVIKNIHLLKYNDFLRRLLSIFTGQIMVNGHERINVRTLVKSFNDINKILA